jgi:hypothetical protein
MRAMTRACGLTLFLLAVFGLPAFALDDCPKGEFTLEGGCVLCLPGYTPQKTGNKNPQGRDCYACLPSKSAVVQNEPQAFCANSRQIDLSAGPGALSDFLAAQP